jgi:hypothetical protein
LLSTILSSLGSCIFGKTISHQPCINITYSILSLQFIRGNIRPDYPRNVTGQVMSSRLLGSFQCLRGPPALFSRQRLYFRDTLYQLMSLKTTPHQQILMLWYEKRQHGGCINYWVLELKLHKRHLKTGREILWGYMCS